MNTKSKFFVLLIPALPNMAVFNPNVRWIRGEDYNGRYLKADNFEDAFIEAKREYIEIRNEKLEWISKEHPEHYNLLKETYPKEMIISFQEERILLLDE